MQTNGVRNTVKRGLWCQVVFSLLDKRGPWYRDTKISCPSQIGSKFGGQQHHALKDAMARISLQNFYFRSSVLHILHVLISNSCDQSELLAML